MKRLTMDHSLVMVVHKKKQRKALFMCVVSSPNDYQLSISISGYLISSAYQVLDTALEFCVVRACNRCRKMYELPLCNCNIEAGMLISSRNFCGTCMPVMATSIAPQFRP